MGAVHRARGAVLVMAVAATGLGLVVPGSSSASCVGPQLTVLGEAAPTTPAPAPTDQAGRPVALVQVTAGGDLVVVGHWFFDGCNDTSSSTGCSAPTESPPAPPARHVALVLDQGSQSWTLGHADASGPGHRWRVRWQATLPADLEPGPATLTARGASVPVLVTG